MVQKFFQYWNTIRHLKIKQIFGYIKNKFKVKNKIYLSNRIELKKKKNYWIKPILRKQKMFSPNTFKFLNEENEIKVESDWNNQSFSKLWLYNLHYFDDLVSIQSKKRINWHRSIIQKWIDHNPTFSGIGWEPYPTSLRIINWIKWSLNGNRLKDEWLKSLFSQASYLSHNIETHLLGNHLFSNAKALIFAGLFFKGESAEKWYLKGLEILKLELPEQVLQDGGHFELSPMYHSLFIEDLCDIINVHFLYNIKKPDKIFETIYKMLDWLFFMSHPDGEISFFNDSAFNISPKLNELTAYVNRLSGDYKSETSPLKTLLNSGYTKFNNQLYHIIIDHAKIGPDYIPGHGHADALSFELSISKQRIIVNTGISVYEDSKARYLERSTESHSTIMIDGKNSSDVWKAFRVGRRANIINFEVSNNNLGHCIQASHDGYKYLPGRPIHTRKWILKEKEIIIYDKISGNKFHQVSSIYPIHPNIKIIFVDHNRIKFNFESRTVSFKINGMGKLEKMPSFYHPEFGIALKNYKLVYKVAQTLPIEIETIINCD